MQEHDRCSTEAHEVILPDVVELLNGCEKVGAIGHGDAATLRSIRVQSGVLPQPRSSGNVTNAALPICQNILELVQEACDGVVQGF